LIRFLFNNKDVFAWSANDLCGVNRDVIEHSLNVDPSFRPRKQRLRKMSDDVGVSTPGVPGPTSKFVAACPSPDGLAQEGTQGESAAHVIPHQGGVLVVGVTSVRERERE
jgi:hypothetical protein